MLANKQQDESLQSGCKCRFLRSNYKIFGKFYYAIHGGRK